MPNFRERVGRLVIQQNVAVSNGFQFLANSIALLQIKKLRIFLMKALCLINSNTLATFTCYFKKVLNKQR